MFRFIYLKCLMPTHIYRYSNMYSKEKIRYPNKIYIFFYTSVKYAVLAKYKISKTWKSCMNTYRFCYWFIIKILFKMKYKLSLELCIVLSSTLALQRSDSSKMSVIDLQTADSSALALCPSQDNNQLHLHTIHHPEQHRCESPLLWLRLASWGQSNTFSAMLGHSFGFHWMRPCWNNSFTQQPETLQISWECLYGLIRSFDLSPILLH